MQVKRNEQDIYQLRKTTTRTMNMNESIDQRLKTLNLREGNHKIAQENRSRIVLGVDVLQPLKNVKTGDVLVLFPKNLTELEQLPGRCVLFFLRNTN